MQPKLHEMKTALKISGSKGNEAVGLNDKMRILPQQNQSTLSYPDLIDLDLEVETMWVEGYGMI